MRDIKYIVVHCTAGNQKQTIAELKAYWKKAFPKWTKFGYHIVVDAAGVAHQITPDDQIANGVAGHNANSIHISYIGGIDAKGKPVDNRTTHQISTLSLELKRLKAKYPKAKIVGHRDFSPDTNKNGKIDYYEYIKYCPCFEASVEYAHL